MDFIDVSALPIWGNVIVFIAMVALVAVGAGWFVTGAGEIGRRLGMSELVLGLTVVAIGTSAPEFAVSVTAALGGQGNLAVSNVVGSNVFNLGIILGLVCLIRPLQTGATVTWRDGGFLLLGTVATLVFVAADLQLGRAEGITLMSALGIYLVWIVRSARVQKNRLGLEEQHEAPTTSLPADIGLFVLGLAVILAASRLLVDSATTVALDLGVSEWVIGVTVVAAGTSAPELATALVAARKGRTEMGVGALLGSDIFNVFGVLGVTATITPVQVVDSAVISLVSLSLMVALVIVLMRSGWRLSRRDGAILLAVALVRWAVDIFGTSG